MLRTLTAAAFIGLAAFVPALAADTVTVGSLAISRLWTTATPPGAPTATGYLTVTNGGSTGDRLVAVSSPIAGDAMLHQVAVTNGVASMRMVEGIDIPAGKTVTLDPESFHLMFVTLSKPLKAGDTVPVTLTFANAGKVDAQLQVLPLGSRAPGQ